MGYNAAEELMKQLGMVIGDETVGDIAPRAQGRKMNYYIGVDLGGTNIAVGILDEKYNIIAKRSIATNCPRSAESIAEKALDKAAFISSNLFSFIKS